MPVYEYRGVSRTGKQVKGVRDADSPRSLRELLRKEGIYVSELGETAESSDIGGRTRAGSSTRRRRFGRKVKVMEVAEVTRQLATLLKASIPIVDSLAAVSRQTENPRLQRIFNEVRRSVSEGKSLAGALGEHASVFPELYVNMVKAGESSGTLDIVFMRLADFTEAQAQLRSRVMGAMTYPIIMMFVTLGIVSLLMLFVVPKLTVMFEEMGTELPLVTRVLIQVSDFFRDYWYALFGGLILLGWWFNRYRKGERGKHKWDRFVLRMPLFGPLVRMVGVARFTRTMGTLLGSGVPIISALEIVKHVVGNHILAQTVEDARNAVKEGENLATPLQRSGEFPPMVVHMIAVGEQSGQLEEMLDTVAGAYEMQVDSRLNTLTRLLEPLMIVVMGGIVAFIVFAVMSPMLQMNSLLKG